jgi:hypothetical protein
MYSSRMRSLTVLGGSPAGLLTRRPRPLAG